MSFMKQQTTKLLQRSISEKFVNRYVELILWLLDPLDKTQYRILGMRIQFYLKHNGDKFTVMYLKECTRLVHHFVAGTPTFTPQKDATPRVASRKGLPLIIPGPLRLQMMANGLVCIRTVLTILSIFRIIKYPGILKLSTIVDAFKGVSTTLNVTEVAWVWATKFAARVPKTPKGLDTLLMLKTAGPNYKISILGAPLDAYAWKHVASEDLRKAFFLLSDHFHSGLGELLKLEMELVSKWVVKREVKLGKLSKKQEPAGKIRVFAIADVWTQSVLEPIHTLVFNYLKTISDVDGTFDQAGPIRSLQDKLSKKADKFVASYDLSAATDRLPIDLQVQVLSQLLGNPDIALAWKTLLVDRDWWLGNESLRYSVGQPMGALSSWGMLALTHHFIVQIAASRVGKTAWFEDYAILGDDIVIADKAVADCYFSLMTDWLGVEINLDKSIVSRLGVMEFAKRIVTPLGEISPIGAKNISQVLSNPANIPAIFLDFIGKGGTLDWTFVDEKLKQLSHRTDIIRVRSRDLLPLTWTIIGPFGFVTYPGLAPTSVANSLEEYDPVCVLEGFDLALQSLDSKDQSIALEKTMQTVNSLRKVANEFGVRVETSGFALPPSFQMVIRDADLQLGRLAGEIQSGVPFYGEIPLEGKTLGEVLTMKLANRVSVSPLDNPLVRPRVTRLRVRKVALSFFRLVLRYTRMLQEM